jgi:hypothetical protein
MIGNCCKSRIFLGGRAFSTICKTSRGNDAWCVTYVAFVYASGGGSTGSDQSGYIELEKVA